jgi:hypothetical protein
LFTRLVMLFNQEVNALADKSSHRNVILSSFFTKEPVLFFCQLDLSSDHDFSPESVITFAKVM